MPILYSFRVECPRTGAHLMTVPATSWLSACVRAGREIPPHVPFKVRSGVPMEDS